MLEAWAVNERVPEGKRPPLGIEALASWADADLGLRAWTSPNIAAPGGKHRDLRLRYDAAIKLLLKGSATEEETAASLKKRVRELKAHQRGLAGQILNMRCEIQDKDSEIARLQDLITNGNKENASLRSELQKVRPIRVV